ncbi:MAG: hypothetical protein V1761_05015 [bacterium]
MRYRQFQKQLKTGASIPVTFHDGLGSTLRDRMPVASSVERRIPVFRRIAFTLSAAMAVFAAFVCGYLGLDTDVVVTLDANPSIEIEINHFNRVIALNALNPDGEDVIAALDHPQGKPDVVIRAIYDELVAGGYIEAADAFLLLGISGTDQTAGEKLETALAARLSEVTLLYMNSYENPSLQSLTIAFKSAEAIFGYGSPDLNSDIEAAMAEGVVSTTAAWITTTTAWTIPTTAGSDSLTSESLPTEDACPFCSVAIAMDADELAAVAANLGITVAKLRLVITVFNGYPIYRTQSDLVLLAAMPIGELALLYQALP